MNILFACHRLPYPPKRGGKIRPFNIIKHLTEQGHTVTVGTLARSAEEYEEGIGLRDYCQRLHVGRIGRAAASAQMIARLPTTSPSSMGYFFSGALHRAMRAEIDQGGHDLIFVHCSSAAQYVRYNQTLPSILDFGDMDSQKWLDYSSFKPFPMSLGYWLEGKKLYRAEGKLARKFTLCTCTTRAELQTLEDMDVASMVDWFPNGVDTDYFAPAQEPHDENLICFVGRMDYFPNQQAMTRFCRETFPLIRQRRPDVRLMIVGAEPSREIQGLASLAGVEVTGTVDDVRPYVRRAALSIAPLAIARGTQNKILESMAMRVPVLCSSMAAGGVDAVPDEHLLVADSPAAFAEKALGLLGDAQFRERLAQAGRDRVLEHHSWIRSLSHLDKILVRACGGS